MMHPSVKVQIAPSSVPATPSWFGEVAVLAHVLTQFGVLDAIQQRARFARARFGLYDTIDFVVVLIGYAVSGEPTLKAFYERLGLLLPRSWLSLAATPFPVIPPSAVFSRLLISQVSKPSGFSFKRIWWHDPRSVLHQVGCGIVWESIGFWSISMEPNRQHDSGHFPRQKTFPLLIVVSIGCAPKGISGASEDRWGEPGPRCYSHTRINGSAPFQVQETAITEQNCDKRSKPSRCTRPRLRFPSPRLSCGLMGCTETRLLSMRFSPGSWG